MPMDELLGVVGRLNASMEALGALAAWLRITVDELDPDPTIQPHLERIVAEVAGEATSDLTTEQRRMALGAIRAFFMQAAELIENPDRPPGWVYDDPTILQSQGQASGMVPPLVAQSFEHLDGLAERLAGGGAILDVGCGVGALAISASRLWPAAMVVGVDPWKPSLALAHGNVERAGLGDRIELRQQPVQDLPDRDRFDLVWLPGPFLPEAALGDAIAVSRRAATVGGWVVLGLYAGPDDTLANELMNLRILRSGGHVLAPDDAAAALTAGGWKDVTVLPRPWHAPMLFVAGRRGD